jgi:hypothetical protein
MTVTPQVGVTHDIVLDPDGENLGLKIAHGGWQMRQALPFAAKPGTAKPERSFADLTDWSVWEQTTWAHGALQEDFDDDGMYLFGSIDSRFTRQLILPPDPRVEPIGTGTSYICGAQDMQSLTFSTASTERYAQQFECEAETDCEYIYLWAGRLQPAVVAVGLYTDSANLPGTQLAFKSREIFAAEPKWTRFRWTAGTQTLSAATKYWLVFYVTDLYSPKATIGYDKDSGYADGLAKQSTDSGANWTAFSGDFYFIIQDGVQAGWPITGPFAIFEDDEYVIGGPNVYVHDDANADWDDAGAGMNQAQVGTGLIVYNGVMYACQDTGYDIRKTSDGSTWADIGGTSFTEARCFCVHGGMLYKARANIARYSSDPEAATPSWSSAITVGTTEHKILTMVSTQWGLIVLKADGGWLVPGRPGQEDRAYRIDALNWSTRPIDGTGVGGIPAVVWSDGMLYIAERGGLLRWDGEVATPVGLDLGTGLPSPYPGNVTGLLRHTNFLFLAVGAGSDTDDNLSSIWAYNGGWHKLADAYCKGANIACLGYTTKHSPERILYGIRKSVAHIQMPDTTDNPAQYASPIYAPSGNIGSSAFSAGLPNADKIFLSLGVHAERVTSTQAVNVYYRVDADEDAGWSWLGEITDEGLTTFDLPVADFTKRQVSAGCTKLVLQVADATGITAEDWVCINQEYGQVVPGQYGAATELTLTYPLSAAPDEDDWLYPGVAVGKKIWYQLVLSSEDKGKTPVIKGVYVKYRVLLKDKRVWRVVATLAPGDRLLTGQPAGGTVKDARAALWRLARRAQVDCLPPGYRTSGEKLSVIITDYSEFLVDNKPAESGGRPEHSYQITLSLLEV